MKRLPLLLLIFWCCRATAQAPASLVSMTGIGDIKLGMSKAQLEKLTGTTIRLVNLVRTGDDWSRDTVRRKHKGIDYEVVFDRDYMNEKNKAFVVYEINSHSPQLKTRSGIGIGDDKLKIVSTYTDFMIHILPEYEGPEYTVKSKTRSTLWLFGDTSETVIIFYLTNNKVTGFCIMYNEGC